MLSTVCLALSLLTILQHTTGVLADSNFKTTNEASEEHVSGLTVNNDEASVHEPKVSGLTLNNDEASVHEPEVSGLTVNNEESSAHEPKVSGLTVNNDEASVHEPKFSGLTVNNDEISANKRRVSGLTVNNDGTSNNEQKVSGLIVNNEGTSTNKRRVSGLTANNDGTSNNKQKVSGLTVNNDGTSANKRKVSGLTVNNDGISNNKQRVSGLTVNNDGTSTNKRKVSGLTVTNDGTSSNKQRVSGLAVTNDEKSATGAGVRDMGDLPYRAPVLNDKISYALANILLTASDEELNLLKNDNDKMHANDISSLSEEINKENTTHVVSDAMMTTNQTNDEEDKDFKATIEVTVNNETIVPLDNGIVNKLPNSLNPLEADISSTVANRPSMTADIDPINTVKNQTTTANKRPLKTSNTTSTSRPPKPPNTPTTKRPLKKPNLTTKLPLRISNTTTTKRPIPQRQDQPNRPILQFLGIQTTTSNPNSNPASQPNRPILQFLGIQPSDATNTTANRPILQFFGLQSTTSNVITPEPNRPILQFLGIQSTTTKPKITTPNNKPNKNRPQNGSTTKKTNKKTTKPPAQFNEMDYQNSETTIEPVTSYFDAIRNLTEFDPLPSEDTTKPNRPVLQFLSLQSTTAEPAGYIKNTTGSDSGVNLTPTPTTEPVTTGDDNEVVTTQPDRPLLGFLGIQVTVTKTTTHVITQTAYSTKTVKRKRTVYATKTVSSLVKETETVSQCGDLIYTVGP